MDVITPPVNHMGRVSRTQRQFFLKKEAMRAVKKRLYYDNAKKKAEQTEVAHTHIHTYTHTYTHTHTHTYTYT